MEDTGNHEDGDHPEENARVVGEITAKEQQGEKVQQAPNPPLSRHALVVVRCLRYSGSKLNQQGVSLALLLLGKHTYEEDGEQGTDELGGRDESSAGGTERDTAGGRLTNTPASQKGVSKVSNPGPRTCVPMLASKAPMVLF